MPGRAELLPLSAELQIRSRRTSKLIFAFNGRTLIPDYAEFMNACLDGGLPLTPSQRSVRM
jgi:hypothetical protein